MQANKTKAELQQHKAKLASSYLELLEQFSSQELRHVGNYTVGKLIGKGSFGKVYLARHDLTNGSKVVLKASKKEDGNLAREIHHHRQFIHPHIARLYEVIVTENLVWLVLEWCPGDELYNYLLKNGPLPAERVQRIFTQLVGAVAYIHSKSCVHRDLKLENVLLDKNENVKLCDFGFTREYEGKANYLQTFCGTVCYSAPEMLRGEKYAGEKVDVWSLGIILYALLKGELPFDEDDDAATKAKILNDEPTYPDTFPEAAKTLIAKLLSKRPLHRPSLADILADPFLTEHAPQQQAILKLSQPAPFTTELEKRTLERMKSAGVDIDKVIENVLSQRCDSLAGWWALLIEKETRKEARRERKRKEKEAELKLLRRLSGASSRLDRPAPTLAEVEEEGDGGAAGAPGHPERRRSSSRGRTQRRSTPQILVSDLPRLPEGSPIQSPGTETPPPPPIDKTSIRSQSGSRPPLPPKEQKRRSSTLQLVTANPDLLGPVNGVNKRRIGKRRNNQFFNQLTSLKRWLFETTKRAKSPNKLVESLTSDQGTNGSSTHNHSDMAPPHRPDGHNRHVSGASVVTRSSYGATLTPIASNMTNRPGLDTTRITRPQRNSLSPSPVTPRSSYRRRSVGLRGRKSTSSSVSSIRSMPRHASHSKASSRSSNSMDTMSPGSRSAARSPHPSIKVLPVTPTTTHFRANIRVIRDPLGGATTGAGPMSPFDEAAIPNHPGGVMFARRKKSPFKGPMLNSAFFGMSIGPGVASPVPRPREASDGKLNLGLRNLARRAGSTAGSGERKSQIIEEEDEEGHDDGDEEVEEVDVFSPVDLAKGERVQSITIWDDPVEAEHDGVGLETTIR